MKRIIITVCFCAFICTSFAQIDKNRSFGELRTKTTDLYQANKTDSAIIIMEYAFDNFPEEYQQSTLILGSLYTRSGKYSKAIAIWKSGMEKGYNYHLTSPGYLNYYKDNLDFMKLLHQEKDKLDTAHIAHEIILPKNYDPNHHYPVLFIFHGNGRYLEISKESWISPVMKEEYISIFVQSYIHSDQTNFVWKLNDDKTEKEFKELYSKVLTTYPVDTSNIILAGMSAGGELALDFAFNELVPISGVVLNCPVVPREINEEFIGKFISKNKRLGIITGENDFALDMQKSLIKRIKEKGGQSKITINEEIGHEFGQDFTKQLDEYLEWISGSDCTQSDKSFFETKDAYFGLKAPGLIPEVFASGIVSDSSWAEHCQMAISPSGKEIYWSAWSSRYPPADTSMKNSEQIYFSEFKNGEWSKPSIASFIKDHLTCLNGGPSFSPDGNRLYFYSTGIEGGFGLKDVWYAEKTSSGWSEPINAGAPLNTDVGDWTPSFTKKGHAYHMGNTYYDENEKPLQFKYSNGKFSDPKPVIIHPDYRPAFAIYVAPDESYLIFSGIHKDGFGSLDMYIAFKNDDNIWGTPINMGNQINTDKVERFPIVSPDGKYLFFMRHTPGQDIFWVSTDVISDIKIRSNNLEQHD